MQSPKISLATKAIQISLLLPLAVLGVITFTSYSGLTGVQFTAGNLLDFMVVYFGSCALTSPFALVFIANAYKEAITVVHKRNILCFALCALGACVILGVLRCQVMN